MKFKITMTVTREYEVTETDLVNLYGGVDSFEEALALDIENTKDEPFIFIDFEDSKFDIKGEIL